LWSIGKPKKKSGKECLSLLVFFILFNAMLYFRVTVPFSIQLAGVASMTRASLVDRGDGWYNESRSASTLYAPSVWPTGKSTDPFIADVLQRMDDANMQQEMRNASVDSFWPYFLINVIQNRFIPSVYFCGAFAMFAFLCGHAMEDLKKLLVPLVFSIVAFVIIPSIASYIWPPVVVVNESLLEFVTNSHTINWYGGFAFYALLVGQFIGSFYLLQIVFLDN